MTNKDNNIPEQGKEKIETEARLNLIWDMIEEWQMSRDKDADIDEEKFSYQDIEHDLYQWMEKMPQGNSLASLLQERDRLRQALEKIAALPDISYGADGYTYDPDEAVNSMAEIARNALNPHQ